MENNTNITSFRSGNKLPILNTNPLVVTDVEDLVDLVELNKVIVSDFDKTHLFLGQSFSWLKYLNLKSGEVETYTYSSTKSFPQEEVEFWVAKGKMESYDVNYPDYVSIEDSVIKDSTYKKLVSLVLNRAVEFDFTKYYGEGPKGCGATLEDQTEFFDKFGRKFGERVY